MTYSIKSPTGGYYVWLSPEDLHDACEESKSLWPEPLLEDRPCIIHLTVASAIDLAKRDGDCPRCGALGWMETRDILPQVLIGADLTNADLTNADLTDADLTGANLYRANFTDANLTGADLTDANLEGTILEKMSEKNR